MEKYWEICIGIIEPQLDEANSFVGGKPKLPLHTSLPVCKLCKASQTYFFQLEFPKEHEWYGFSIAVFACTSCANENYLIPIFPKGNLKGAILDHKYFGKYETNFHFIIFETSDAVLIEDYEEKIEFKKINLCKVDCNSASNNRMGGIPNWFLEDEGPGKFENTTDMVFLFQLEQEMQFEISSAAPKQVLVSYSGKPRFSSNNYYELFLANELYFFGVNDFSNPYVYVIPQS